MSRRGIAYALASVALASAAQLAMRWSMTRLPRLESLPQLRTADDVRLLAVAMLLMGVLGYALSLLSWLGALAHLPLNRAYALLGLSYPLVYLSAAVLPGLGGSLSTGKTCGVVLVVLGVLLVHAPPSPGVERPGESL